MKHLSDARKTAMMLCLVVFTMGALAWAAVPLYDLFCRVTGFGGTPSRAIAGSDIVLDKTIKIRFDASTARDMPWEFHAKQKEITLKIGDSALAFYEAYNPTDKAITGVASFNVTPYDAGGYFTKIDCFCFQEQLLAPGERVDMPVAFYVDPQMLDDPTARKTPRITLSYTFHVAQSDESNDTAGLGKAGQGKTGQNKVGQSKKALKEAAVRR